MKEYYLYLHLFPNKKKYVGVTCQNPSRRWRDGIGYKSQTIMYRAILKYGWDKIEHIILLSGLSKQEAEREERKIIKELKTNDRKYGYNIENGGNTHKVSNETKRKMSEIAIKRFKIYGGTMLGKKHSKKTKANMSLKKIGVNNPMFGRKLTDEHKKRISIANKGKTASKETKNKLSTSHKGLMVGEKHPNYNKHPLSKSVSQYTMDNIFIKKYVSCADAERQTGINYYSIRNNCIKKSKSSGGYRWKYE